LDESKRGKAGGPAYCSWNPRDRMGGKGGRNRPAGERGGGGGQGLDRLRLLSTIQGNAYREGDNLLPLQGRRGAHKKTRGKRDVIFGLSVPRMGSLCEKDYIQQGKKRRGIHTGRKKKNKSRHAKALVPVIES